MFKRFSESSEIERRGISKEYSIVKFKNIIGNHKGDSDKNKKLMNYTADLLIEKDNFFISTGINNIINVYYNNTYLIFKKVKIDNEWVYNVIDEDKQICVCTKNTLYCFTFTKSNLESININSKPFFIIKINKSSYYLCCEK